MVTWEQRVLTGDAKLDASQDLPDLPYFEYAKWPLPWPKATLIHLE